MDAAVGFVMGGGEGSGMDAAIAVADGDLYGKDVGSAMDVAGLSELGVDADSCDVVGLVTADAEDGEGLDSKTALKQGHLVAMLTRGCEDH